MRTLLFLVVFLPCQVFACTCVGTSSVRQFFKQADLVILGEILEKKETLFSKSNFSKNPEMAERSSFKVYRYAVKVLAKYKNYNYDTLYVYSGTGDGDCGVDFIIGKNYIVYANQSGDFFSHLLNERLYYHTDDCTGTKLYIEDEINELKNLSKNKKWWQFW